jgi:DNA-binding transcriptional regulator YdaS (Cro superfamily)
MHLELKARLLRRACDIAGGRERLATRLGVEVHALEFWMSGRATPPERVFLSVVDMVLDDDIARAAQDRRQNAVQRAVLGAWPERPAKRVELP